MPPRLLHVVGARPNFPKLAPVFRAGGRRVEQAVVHTGQHYDEALSESFFRDLGIPAPDESLEVGSGSHAEQTARIIERLEPVLLRRKPDWLVVYGDVNSTMAACIVASKLGVKIAHVEAGLRSGDRTMPEEVNRIVTDRLADLLLTPSHDASATLKAEGEPEHEIVFVGNVMADTLLHSLQHASNGAAREKLSLGRPYVLVTLHRPSNVDSPARLARVMDSLERVAERVEVFFPAHPRSAAALKAAKINPNRVRVAPPVAYFEMLELMQNADAVITDSGGVQEETTVLGVPCFTLRPNTERPVTITEGTNTLVPEPEALPDLVRGARRPASPRRPDGWDGHAGERVIAAILARS
jgi:UDP-N-acetylglucosamine 2-epimerase (non-hydrolysing)